MEHQLTSVRSDALHLEIFPPAQRAVWSLLGHVPTAFVLYGGTAIALQLGHRRSVDFDFFARSRLDHDALQACLEPLQPWRVVQSEPNTLSILQYAQDPVQCSFFGVPRLPELYPPHDIAEPRIRLADLRELAGMKCSVVQKRAEAKDYLDIHALVQFAKIPLIEQLRHAKALYGSSFSPEATLKALSYFEDGNVATVPVAIKRDLAQAIRGTRLDQLAS